MDEMLVNSKTTQKVEKELMSGILLSSFNTNLLAFPSRQDKTERM